MWTIAGRDLFVGATAMRPSACGTPFVILTAISVSASPMSIRPKSTAIERTSTPMRSERYARFDATSAGLVVSKSVRLGALVCEGSS